MTRQIKNLTKIKEEKKKQKQLEKQSKNIYNEIKKDVEENKITYKIYGLLECITNVFVDAFNLDDFFKKENLGVLIKENKKIDSKKIKLDNEILSYGFNWQEIIKRNTNILVKYYKENSIDFFKITYLEKKFEIENINPLVNDLIVKYTDKYRNVILSKYNEVTEAMSYLIVLFSFFELLEKFLKETTDKKFKDIRTMLTRYNKTIKPTIIDILEER